MRISRHVHQLIARCQAQAKAHQLIVERMQLAHAAGDAELVLALRDRLPRVAQGDALYWVRVGVR